MTYDKLLFILNFYQICTTIYSRNTDGRNMIRQPNIMELFFLIVVIIIFSPSVVKNRLV